MRRRHRVAMGAVTGLTCAGLGMAALAPASPAVRFDRTAAVTAGALTATPAPGGRTAAYNPKDPATWSNRQLAAQLTFSCVNSANLPVARRHAAIGIGGIALMGRRPPPDLRRQLASLTATAPHGIVPFIAGDEEGGSVQRLGALIHPLPSARTMGSWRTGRIRATAKAYGARMRALGVTMDLGPVADLAVPGLYMDSLGRAFSARPATVSADVQAWSSGMRAARVTPVVKHWPGHGSAANTHKSAGPVPALSVLKRRDMVPFDDQFRRGAPVVMVGHLTSPGLTGKGVPASLSPRALSYLRGRVTQRTVILTDSLSMGAASAAQGISPPAAAVRALRAGADWAMVCAGDANRTVTAIARALSSGSYSRQRAIASVRRILELKSTAGILPRQPSRAPDHRRLARAVLGPGLAALQQGLEDALVGWLGGSDT